MKLLVQLMVMGCLTISGVGCKDSSGASGPSDGWEYRPQVPAPADVRAAAQALLVSCDEAGIPWRESLTSHPGHPAISTIVGHPVHPSVESWFDWQDSLGLPESPRQYVELPSGGAFLPRSRVQAVLAEVSAEDLGAAGFPGKKLVPVAGTSMWVSVECDPESPRYGAVVVSSERGWMGAQFYPSLAAYLNYLRACVQEEAVIWDRARGTLVLDQQRIREIEAEIGVATQVPQDLAD